MIIHDNSCLSKERISEEDADDAEERAGRDLSQGVAAEVDTAATDATDDDDGSKTEPQWHGEREVIIEHQEGGGGCCIGRSVCRDLPPEADDPCDEGQDDRSPIDGQDPLREEAVVMQDDEIHRVADEVDQEWQDAVTTVAQGPMADEVKDVHQRDGDDRHQTGIEEHFANEEPLICCRINGHWRKVAHHKRSKGEHQQRMEEVTEGLYSRLVRLLGSGELGVLLFADLGYLGLIHVFMKGSYRGVKRE